MARLVRLKLGENLARLGKHEVKKQGRENIVGQKRV